jgi:hypothetical protein
VFSLGDAEGVGLHVLVDGLGVLLGAQYVFAAAGEGGGWRRDVSLRANVAALSALVEGGRSVRQRLVWGPAAASGGGAWRRWRQCGYETRRCAGGPAAFSADGSTGLQGEMAAEVDRQLLLSPSGARRTLVLLVCRRYGEGEAALAAAVSRALHRGWDVEAWAWDVAACDWFLEADLASGSSRFTFNSFDGARKGITFTSSTVATAVTATLARHEAMVELSDGNCNRGGGNRCGGGNSDGGGSGGDSPCRDGGANTVHGSSGSEEDPEEDEEDDWAMCLITCEPMKDPVLVRGGGPRHFERSALEAWVARASTCPLTRRPLGSADVVPPDPAFAARLAARRARDGLA